MAESKKSSPWVWISLGLIIATFTAFILFLDQKIVKNTVPATVDSAPRDDDVSKPVFDFYTVLPEREVDIPQRDDAPAIPNPRSDDPLASQVRYILQAGSFAKAEDADRRKAELAFIGLEPKVAKAMVNGIVYHRVELGPFADDGRLSDIKNRLIQNDINYIARKSQ